MMDKTFFFNFDIDTPTFLSSVFLQHMYTHFIRIF